MTCIWSNCSASLSCVSIWPGVIFLRLGKSLRFVRDPGQINLFELLFVKAIFVENWSCSINIDVFGLSKNGHGLHRYCLSDQLTKLILTQRGRRGNSWQVWRRANQIAGKYSLHQVPRNTKCRGKLKVCDFPEWSCGFDCWCRLIGR